jgi:GTPase SAR1 family protein
MAEFEQRSSIIEMEDNCVEDLQSIKLVVIGDNNVGKSTFVSSYFDNNNVSNDDNHKDQTKYCKKLNINSEKFHDKINLECVSVKSPSSSSSSSDSERIERKPEESHNIFHNANGVFILYDITNRKSFDYVDNIMNELIEYCEDDDLMIFIIANKNDLNLKDNQNINFDNNMINQNGNSSGNVDGLMISPPIVVQVSSEDGKKLTSNFGGIFHEISSKYTTISINSRTTTTTTTTTTSTSTSVDTTTSKSPNSINSKDVIFCFEEMIYAIVSVLSAHAHSNKDININSRSSMPDVECTPSAHALINSLKLNSSSSDGNDTNDDIGNGSRSKINEDILPSSDEFMGRSNKIYGNEKILGLSASASFANSDATGKGNFNDIITPESLTEWISKKSNYLKFWNKRYFTLIKGKLYFRLTEDIINSKGTGNGRSKNSCLYLSYEVIITKKSKINRVGKEDKYDLNIETPSKSFLLRFDNELLLDKWYNAINEHCHYGTIIHQKAKYIK